MKAIETALSLTQAYKLGIERFEKMLGNEFTKAVEYMNNTSTHIIVCGMGKSGLVGRKISSTLASTGTPSIFLHPAEAIHGDLGKVQKKICCSTNIIFRRNRWNNCFNSSIEKTWC